jgi:hypothetical protein
MTSLPPHINLFYEFLTGLRERRAWHRREIHGWRGTLQSRQYLKPHPNIIRLRHSSSPASRHRYAKFFRSLRQISERRIRVTVGHIAPSLVVAGPNIATARNMAAPRRLRQVSSASVSRGNRAGESAWSTGGSDPKSTSRSVSCFPTAAIFAPRGSSPERRRGDTSRSVHTAGDPIIYGLSPLLTAFVASAPSPSSLRIPSPRQARAVRIFCAHDGAAIHRRFSRCPKHTERHRNE